MNPCIQAEYINELYEIYKKMKQNKIKDWLLKYEFLEATNCNRKIDWINNIYLELEQISNKNNDLSRAIKRGIKLFG